jgi:hypothetical protein
MQMVVKQSNKVVLAAYCGAHSEHAVAELEFYAQLATQQAAAAVLGAGASMPSFAHSSMVGASTSAASSITAANSSMKMETDWWDDLVREVDGQLSEEDDGF